MLHKKESGGLLEWIGWGDPKEESGSKIVLDCGGDKFATYEEADGSPFTASVCLCNGTFKGGKLYGLGGAWGCPPIWGGTGAAFLADPWTTTPEATLDAIDSLFEESNIGEDTAPLGVAFPYPVGEDLPGLGSGNEEPKGAGSRKPKNAPAPGVAIVPAPGGLVAAPPGIPWWIWALAAGGGAWFLLRKRGA